MSMFPKKREPASDFRYLHSYLIPGKGIMKEYLRVTYIFKCIYSWKAQLSLYSVLGKSNVDK